MKTDGTIRNLQALRALAAFMVVFYHARLLTPTNALVSFEFGDVGIDIFFVISGFIIANVTALDDGGAPGKFLVKRLIRIVPLYWLFTLAMFVVAQRFPALAGAGGRPDLVILLKSLTFIPYYDGSGQMHPIVFIGWTLDYEMFFYLVFAAALVVRNERIRLVAVTVLLAGLAAAGQFLHPTGAVASTYTDILLLDFVAGMWISYGYRSDAVMPATRASRALLLAAAATAFLLILGGDVWWHDLARPLKWGLPAIALVASAVALERLGVRAGWRWLMLLGEASYSTYLVHPFVIKAATLAYQRIAVRTLIFDLAVMVAVVLGVAAAGLLVHLAVEKPTIRFIRRRLLPQGPPSIAQGEQIVR